eukprot:CAMPEP_0174829414 /NCGR_PEP_ID=MMETSP1114-20130205/1916_1 /TAXON_ID=312471 /ORGANISM="Neobodo designis, Strain CCAP 1951/1" /LENGTH=93 /DNA_ID=CAMNT_0016063161 /DNA_START=143 /DNA_END=424 /DNA_ORIENTATION=-
MDPIQDPTVSAGKQAETKVAYDANVVTTSPSAAMQRQEIAGSTMDPSAAAMASAQATVTRTGPVLNAAMADPSPGVSKAAAAAKEAAGDKQDA